MLTLQLVNYVLIFTFCVLKIEISYQALVYLSNAYCVCCLFSKYKCKSSNINAVDMLKIYLASENLTKHTLQIVN